MKTSLSLLVCLLFVGQTALADDATVDAGGMNAATIFTAIKAGKHVINIKYDLLASDVEPIHSVQFTQEEEECGAEMDKVLMVKIDGDEQSPSKEYKVAIKALTKCKRRIREKAIKYVLSLQKVTDQGNSESIALSASICRARVVRKVGMDVIAHARKASRIGGVTNKKTISDGQELVMLAERQEREKKEELRSLKLKALPCTNPAVIAADTCADDPNECQLDGW